MRILHVVASISDVDGGPGMAALEMCRVLEAAGHEALLATTSFDGPGRTLPIPPGEIVRYRGAQVIAFPMVGSSEWRKPSPGLKMWLRRELSNFDVVHIHGLFAKSTWDAARAARRWGVPYVLAPVGHAMKSNIGLRRFRNGPKRIYMGLFERWAFQGASSLLFTSQLEQDLSPYACGFGRPRVIIPPSLPREAFAQRAGRPAHQPPRVGFLGRLHPIKGFDTWLPALGKLAAQGVEFELHLAGPATSWSEENLRNIVKQCGLSGCTHFRSRLEGDERWEFLSELDLFLLLSRTENFGVAAAEAMACGTAVAVTESVGCSEWLAGADVGAVLPGNRDAIAEGLGRLLGDPEELREQGARAVLLARRCFSEPAVADHLVLLYRNCISTGE